MNDEDFGDVTTALRHGADLARRPPADLLDRVVQRRRQQRRTRAALVGAALAVVVIGAGVPVGMSFAARSDGAPATQPFDVSPSAPVTSTSAPPTPAVLPSSPAADTSAPESRAPGSEVATSSSAVPATTVLGPDGLGPLTLGMTRAQAEATGVVAPFRNEPNSDACLWRTDLVDQPDGSGTVFYSETLGVATIDAPPGVPTVQGIEVGSPLTAVLQADPGFVAYGDDGHGGMPVPGADDRIYRIGYSDGVVTEVTLQYVQQDCYE